AKRQCGRGRLEPTLCSTKPASGRASRTGRYTCRRRWTVALSAISDWMPTRGSWCATALDLAETRDVEGEPERSPAARRADALVDMASFFLDHHDKPLQRRHRPHVSVIVDLDDDQHRRYASGTPLSEVTASTFLCDSDI